MPAPSDAKRGERSRASAARRIADGGKRLPVILLRADEAAALAVLTADGRSMRDAVGAALVAAAALQPPS